MSTIELDAERGGATEDLRYTLKKAARMAGFPSAGALRVYLHRHKAEFPNAEYRGKKFDKRKPRLLTLGEIRTIREKAVK